MPLRPIKFNEPAPGQLDRLLSSIIAKPVYLWLVERMDSVGYDEFSAILVTAHSKEEALAIKADFPGENEKDSAYGWPKGAILQARAVGTAMPGIDAGQVIIADYRAG